MQLLLIGCEYAGTTTLANGIVEWAEKSIGAFQGVPDEYRIHDHFKIPHISHPPEFTEEEHRQILALSPRVKEMMQRHNVFYHLPHQGWGNSVIMIGLYFDDNVYGPLYFDYLSDLAPDDPIMQTRSQFENWLLKGAPEILLVHVKASPEVIRRRMTQDPHPNAVLKEKDVEFVLRRFEEEFDRSDIPRKIVLDTGVTTVDETIGRFALLVKPYLSEVELAALRTDD